MFHAYLPQKSTATFAAEPHTLSHTAPQKRFRLNALFKVSLKYKSHANISFAAWWEAFYFYFQKLLPYLTHFHPKHFSPSLCLHIIIQLLGTLVFAREGFVGSALTAAVRLHLLVGVSHHRTLGCGLRGVPFQ